MEPVDHDLESILLGYEGNALFMNGQHERSTEILEIGMRLYPHDYRFQRALATVSEKWAEKVLGLERSKRTWCSIISLTSIRTSLSELLEHSISITADTLSV